MTRMKLVNILLLLGLVNAVCSDSRLGMEDGRITDAQITASSCYDGNHCTDRARLNQPAGGGKTGAWSARQNNQYQYIQADLYSLHKVSGVITQGRNAHDQWVTSYKVHYSLDGLTWNTAFNDIYRSEIFTGNTDRDTEVTNYFAEGVPARFIRIIPVTWANHISTRFEIIGTVITKVEGGEFQLGMRKGMIPDAAITSSSSYDGNHGPERARLDIAAAGAKKGAWSARTNDASQWLQVDLIGYHIVTGVITQGRQDVDQWVTDFEVAYSSDASSWIFVVDCSGSRESFPGNSDRNTKVTSRFVEPFIARYIRIHPTSWYGHISLRMEVLGKGPVAGQRFEPRELGMESGRIADTQLSASTCYDVNHCTDRARLNQVAGGGRTGAWSALINNLDQWFQVDLLENRELHGIITQGRDDADQWVTSFKLQYRADGDPGFVYLESKENGPCQVEFSGNADRNTHVVNKIRQPVTARYVRILPVTWYGHISMRFELLGQAEVVQVPDKLGIEDGRVPVSSLSASSCWDGGHCVSRSRLNQPQLTSYLRGAWSAEVLDTNQWIQVDLSSAFVVTGVITQGRHQIIQAAYQWVTSYKISYSIDGKDWTFVENFDNSPKVFAGNNDPDNLVGNAISPPVAARFVRLHPVTWHAHISLRWEVIGHGPVLLANPNQTIGLEDYRVPDASLSASSVYDPNFVAQRGRLNSPSTGWAARTIDQNQWFQVDLGGIYRVAGVMTQGRVDYDQWVTSFSISHRKGGESFSSLVDAATSAPQIFPGNTDRTTVITNTFSPALTTRYIRVHPVSWYGHITMRMELIGTGPVADIIEDPLPLGIETFAIPDASLTASSEWDADHGAKRARLNIIRTGNLRGGWSAGSNDVSQWLQVSLPQNYRIVKLATQGRSDVDQWVTSYKVSCSLDGVSFDTVQDICTNPTTDNIFTANNDRNTVVTNYLPVPRLCRYLRVLPVTWHGHISVRLELYGEGPIEV